MQQLSRRPRGRAVPPVRPQRSALPVDSDDDPVDDFGIIEIDPRGNYGALAPVEETRARRKEGTTS